VLASLRRALVSEALRRTAELEAAPDAAIEVDKDGRVRFGGQAWARLAGGPYLTEPQLKLLHLDLLDPNGRERVRTRLAGWLERWVEALFSALDRPAAAEMGPGARGLVHQLRRGLGVVNDPVAAVRGLSDDDKKLLARLDVRIGTRSVYVQSSLKGPAMAKKAKLWSVHAGLFPLIPEPSNGPTSLPSTAGPRGLLDLLGFRVLGERWVRVDVIERVLAEARAWAREGDDHEIGKVLGWIGCSAADGVAALKDLGFAIDWDGAHRVRVRKAGPPRRTSRRR